MTFVRVDVSVELQGVGGPMVVIGMITVYPPCDCTTVFRNDIASLQPAHLMRHYEHALLAGTAQGRLRAVS
jgi:hypothetical protein